MLICCHSHFSLRYGLLSPADLLKLMAALVPEGQTLTLCIADINNCSGFSDFFREALKYPAIKPLAGIDFCNGVTPCFTGIANTHRGFALLNELLTYHTTCAKPFPERVIQSPFFEAFPHLQPLLAECTFIYPFQHPPNPELLHSFEYIGVESYQLPKLRISALKKHSHKLLARATFTFRNRADFNTHQLLRAIDNNCLLSKLPRTQVGNPLHLFTPPAQLWQLFKEAPELVFTAQKVLDQCTFSFAFGESNNKRTFTGEAGEDFRIMSEMALQGMYYRYPNPDSKIVQRLDKELKVIGELGFTSYFLINWDICRFAREKGFYYVGRGSGANSMVAYCLRITDVDPIDLDLYFERFINPYRNSPPDFDLDFSWLDRDTIIDYIIQRHGKEHAALMATYNTFQSGAVIRELGKVFGVPKHEIDDLLHKLTHELPDFSELAEETKAINEKNTQGVRNRRNFYGSESEMYRHHLQPVVDEARLGKNALEPLYRKILHYAQGIRNLPNYRSIHAGGILISEKPLFYYTALDMPPKGFHTVQFSMLEAEDLGLAKFDILSQRGLGHIKDTIAIVKQNHNEDIDIHRIHDFKKDERIRRLLETGHTMGCFYVESPLMRQLLKKLRCSDYLTLVAASSVVRPGVAKSGMMREYIQRHTNPEARKRAHPQLLEIMPDTYGVMVYQEDVIKVAHYFAGLDLAESDILRRGMSGKYRSREEFQRVKKRFFELCKEKGYTNELTNEVWYQIESFAGFSFAKGHSASYAVESYQSLFLKAYYPLEFYVAVINNFGGFYRTQFYVHAARMCGAHILAPCINNSEYLTGIKETTIWLGFVHLSSLEEQLAKRIVKERWKNGAYTSLKDFMQRTGAGLEQLKILLRINALRSLGVPKKALMWEIHWLFNKKKPEPVALKLFAEEAPKEFKLPQLEYDEVEEAFEQMELLGFPLVSPFRLIDRKASPQKGLVSGSRLKEGLYCGIEGYLVTVRKIRTVKGGIMHFGTWLDSTGNFFDTVHFPSGNNKNMVKGHGVYYMQGKVTAESGVISLEVEKLEKLPYVADPRWE